ncbi:hypothetical protein ACFLIM_07770 [Nonomuraea sp. M3C6]|uniref:S-adenosyl methyltransferase n=1 Tax=Nonomuraea marmarensis TaxID=3351344 RepID=A0ABW7A6W3_9ACTN
MLTPAMRHDPEEMLGALVPAAGFRLETEGNLRPLLFYLRAVKPS